MDGWRDASHIDFLSFIISYKMSHLLPLRDKAKKNIFPVGHTEPCAEGCRKMQCGREKGGHSEARITWTRIVTKSLDGARFTRKAPGWRGVKDEMSNESGYDPGVSTRTLTCAKEFMGKPK